MFGEDFYLEVTRTGRAGEARFLEAALELGAAAGVAVVASNDVRFLDAADYDAHEARVCIHEGRTLSDPRRPRAYSPQQYLKSPAEMASLFEDRPELLANTVAVAQRCSLQFDFGTYLVTADEIFKDFLIGRRVGGNHLAIEF